jgi:hypothetical protein
MQSSAKINIWDQASFQAEKYPLEADRSIFDRLVNEVIDQKILIIFTLLIIIILMNFFSLKNAWQHKIILN